MITITPQMMLTRFFLTMPITRSIGLPLWNLKSQISNFKSESQISNLKSQMSSSRRSGGCGGALGGRGVGVGGRLGAGHERGRVEQDDERHRELPVVAHVL